MGHLMHEIAIGLATSIIGTIVLTEITARSLRVGRWILEIAVRRLPQVMRTRYVEEWQAYLIDQPTPLSSLLAAVGLLWAAERVRAPGSTKWTRVLDRAVASSVLLAIAPTLILISLAIRILDGGPVMYRSMHAGIYGDFSLLRFRTRVRSWSGDGLSDPITYNRRQRAMAGFGTLLRKTSFDRVPELFSVLAGHMSIVGPRPMSTVRFASLGVEPPLVRPGLSGIPILIVAKDHWPTIEEYRSARAIAEANFRERMEESPMSGVKLWMTTVGSGMLSGIITR